MWSILWLILFTPYLSAYLRSWSISYDIYISDIESLNYFFYGSLYLKCTISVHIKIRCSDDMQLGGVQHGGWIFTTLAWQFVVWPVYRNLSILYHWMKTPLQDSVNDLFMEIWMFFFESNISVSWLFLILKDDGCYGGGQGNRVYSSLLLCFQIRHDSNATIAALKELRC